MSIVKSIQILYNLQCIVNSYYSKVCHLPSIILCEHGIKILVTKQFVQQRKNINITNNTNNEQRENFKNLKLKYIKVLKQMLIIKCFVVRCKLVQNII